MTPSPEKDSSQAPLSWSAPQKKADERPTAPAPAPLGQKPKGEAVPQPRIVEERPASSVDAAKLAGWVAAGLVAGVIVAWAGTSLLSRNAPSSNATSSTVSGTQETATPGQGSSGALTVNSPQKAGLSIAASASVSQPTWVAVYESQNGKPGNVLGAALFFPGQGSGTVELLRGTAAGQTYFATLQTDNGDHKFSLHGDPLLTEGGAPLWVSFTAK